MDCLREQEENPLTIDVAKCEEYLEVLGKLKEEKVAALKLTMPKSPINKAKTEPKGAKYKKDGTLSQHWKNWYTFLEDLKLPPDRSEEHTSELQSRLHLVCRLLLEKKNNKQNNKQKHCISTTPQL